MRCLRSAASPRRSSFPLLLAAAVLAGCGGGSGPSSSLGEGATLAQIARAGVAVGALGGKTVRATVLENGLQIDDRTVDFGGDVNPRTLGPRAFVTPREVLVPYTQPAGGLGLFLVTASGSVDQLPDYAVLASSAWGAVLSDSRGDLVGMGADGGMQTGPASSGVSACDAAGQTYAYVSGGALTLASVDTGAISPVDLPAGASSFVGVKLAPDGAFAAACLFPDGSVRIGFWNKARALAASPDLALAAGTALTSVSADGARAAYSLPGAGGFGVIDSATGSQVDVSGLLAAVSGNPGFPDGLYWLAPNGRSGRGVGADGATYEVAFP